MNRLFRRLCAALCVLALCLTSVSALSVQDALNLLEENYIDPLPSAAYRATTLDGLFSAVGDPYTYYMSAEDYAAFSANVESESSVTGIGAAIEYTANGVLITSVLDGGSAKKAGLRPGDLILEIDGISCVPAAEAHRSLIVGDEGTFVSLRIQHTDGAIEDYRLERLHVTIHNTSVSAEDGVGYIDCNSFGSQTSRYFSDGFGAYADVSHWIVDVRGNPGGLADAAVATLGAFTGQGPKLYYRLSDGSSFNSMYIAKQRTEKPVIVLVDGSSASASEIFAGGIRAEQAGIVVGSRTYGKGTAQIILDRKTNPTLFAGDSLKVTVYRFYCTDGVTTDRIGVIPTLLVPDEYAADVAALLKTTQPKSGDYISFTLNDCVFYVSLASARDAETLSVLFAALPPDIVIQCKIGGTTQELSVADAAVRCRVTYTARSFSDVAGSPYASQINTLGAYRIVVGDQGLFHPERTLTRAELAALLAQALNVKIDATGSFSDVAEDQWYFDDVSAMVALGLMNGVGGGRFDPYGSLTQEQLITVMGRLARYLNFHADDYALALEQDGFSDEMLDSLASWARLSAGVLTGYDGNMLYAELDGIDPHAAVTREQAAATMCNILQSLHIISY